MNPRLDAATADSTFGASFSKRFGTLAGATGYRAVAPTAPPGGFPPESGEALISWVQSWPEQHRLRLAMVLPTYWAAADEDWQSVDAKISDHDEAIGADLAKRSSR